MNNLQMEGGCSKDLILHLWREKKNKNKIYYEIKKEKEKKELKYILEQYLSL